MTMKVMKFFPVTTAVHEKMAELEKESIDLFQEIGCKIIPFISLWGFHISRCSDISGFLLLDLKKYVKSD